MPESGTLNDIAGGRPNCSKMSARQPYATASWHRDGKLPEPEKVRAGPFRHR